MLKNFRKVEKRFSFAFAGLSLSGTHTSSKINKINHLTYAQVMTFSMNGVFVPSEKSKTLPCVTVTMNALTVLVGHLAF